MNAQIHLSWDAVANRMPWSQQLLDAVILHKSSLDVGKMENFISGYNNLTPDLQIKCWAELIIAIAKFESDWNPNAIFHEPPPLGVDSVGLLQLSYEDQPIYKLESLDRAKKSLEDPLINIRCGLTIFAKLVAEDGVIASGTVTSTGHKKFRGSARYWSVMRQGHHINDIQALMRHNIGL